MENPHEAEQAVLLERIIKNVVSRGCASDESNLGLPSLRIVSFAHGLTLVGQVQRSRRRDEPLYQGGSG